MDTEPEVDPMLADAISRLGDVPPANDLWPTIARRLAPRHPRGTLLIRWPAALAAGLVIAIAASAGTIAILRRSTPAGEGAGRPASAALTRASFDPGDAALARAVDDLEQSVRGSEDHLEPRARQSIDRGLAALDSAIAEAAARQAASPDDPRAAQYLTSALRKKLQVLRTVSNLTQLQS